MAANPLTTRRLGRLNAQEEPLEIDDRWTDARVAHEVARTRRTTRDDWRRFWRDVQAPVIALLILAAIALIPTAFTAWNTSKLARVMDLTAHWVQQP